jgi:CTP synthase
VYEVPINFERDKLGERILKKLSLTSRRRDLGMWRRLVARIRRSAREVRIGVVGKYFSSGSFILTDSYISVLEAIKHAAFSLGAKPSISWIDSEEFESSSQSLRTLSEYDGIIVPGGFGSRGVEGKIAAIRYCREKKVPFLGLCYGMQLMVVEFARDVAGLKEAHTAEVNPKTPHPVIDIMPDQKKIISDSSYGGTMRLGAYPAAIKKGTVAARLYGARTISERHRHRYEVNLRYIERIERKGLVFSGVSPDRRLMEIAELPADKHPFFVGTQFHPEFKSRPLRPHPLFIGFVRAALARRKK